MGASIIFFALGHKSEPALRVPPGTPLPPAEGSAGFAAEATAELPTHASLSVLPSKRSSPHRRRAARAPGGGKSLAAGQIGGEGGAGGGDGRLWRASTMDGGAE